MTKVEQNTAASVFPLGRRMASGLVRVSRLLHYLFRAVASTIGAPFDVIGMLRKFILLRFVPHVLSSSQQPIVVGKLLRQHEPYSIHSIHSIRSRGGSGTNGTVDEIFPDELGSAAASFDCACYFTENYFIHSPIKAHFSFTSADEFGREHAELLGSLDASERSELLASLEAESIRRCSQAACAKERKARIAAEYAPLYPNLWTLREEWLHEDFVALVRGVLRDHDEWTPPRAIAAGVYALPIFSQQFCELLCAELDAFSRAGLPCGQPNSMNRFGALLDELGFSPGLIDPLMRDWLRPLCAALPPLAAVGGASLDRHKSFVVTYRIGEDEELSEHYDNSEVTLNVNLGIKFEAGELVFYGHRESASSHPLAHHEWETDGVGHGVLHLGAQIHAALPIASGERRNLVIWMRSRSHRLSTGCPMCGETERLLIDEP